MRVLFLVHSFNSLAQRLFVELSEHGMEVSVEFDINDAVTREAVALFKPDVVLAPFLKRAIPEDVFTAVPCLIVHPGVRGDRGPSALDWAILRREKLWGVTILQAEAELDAGPVWTWREFAMRPAAKSSLYRNEVTEAAVEAVMEALAMIAVGDFSPERRSRGSDWEVTGVANPLCRQGDRTIDWQRDSTLRVLRKIRSADGSPGLLDDIEGTPFYHYDVHPAEGLTGEPGALIARSGNAIARATRTGAIWIGHLRATADGSLKLPAVRVLGARAAQLPEVPDGYREISYTEAGDVGFLEFSFYNGAMSTDQCRRLKDAYIEALSRPTKVLVLTGGPDTWSNGLHLGVIEAADSPADESLANIEAMDDLCRAIVTTTDRLVISAVRGNAGAGGVFMALAADEVWARSGVVLNPHYKDMGNLYGSEYWTYLLPKRVGAENAERIAAARLPMGVAEAVRLGLVDKALTGDPVALDDEILQEATALAATPGLAQRIWDKRMSRARDEADRPLADYRAEEIEKMKLNFYGFDPSYHVARNNFIRKVPKSRTPLTLARHRSTKA
ncbi:putative two-component system hydrogenase maturation factor HypX/HoxX [Rhodobium orientis]|uniref:Hydrogenase maturation protein n=1 Tax=Rhodobium orientis TaxID=34017 RepID=A0A327JIC4_9HYPH|nr:hydrogenase maturation protein [Rhodobium orientis]MBB4304426.1 putative two-component system hydrogenase maturation factor HypX/HoxX [Rhodobium orientis]MBK5952032.1 hydrogenase maturation protein [Rhodobium orientis]RAI25805.1 hydrogenase maturation protein [Rhodobium orientis]